MTSKKSNGAKPQPGAKAKLAKASKKPEQETKSKADPVVGSHTERKAEAVTLFEFYKIFSA